MDQEYSVSATDSASKDFTNEVGTRALHTLKNQNEQKSNNSAMS